MITQQVRDVCICDFCHKDGNEYDPCLSCGKHHCYDCGNNHGVDYPHGVFCSGSGDGWYCFECDKKQQNDPLHIAYVAVKHEREKFIARSDADTKRRNECEQEVKRLRKELGIDK